MAEVEYPGAIGMWVPEADLFTTNTHAAIVIHKTASGNTPEEIARYFINSSPGPSVHYIVGLDGTIVQCAPEALGAGGNCCLESGHDPFWDQFGGVNLNTVTLSIEHVDPSLDNSTPCPQAQIDASFKLVAHLAAKYHIAPDHIKPHSSLDPISRARCPGNYPFSALISYVQQQQTGGMWVSPYQEAQALATWNSTTIGAITAGGNTLASVGIFPEGKTPDYNTGIANSWKEQYAAGKNYGPPLGYEFGEVNGKQLTDWTGDPIIQMNFLGGRCEWHMKTAQAKWYAWQS